MGSSQSTLGRRGHKSGAYKTAYPNKDKYSNKKKTQSLRYYSGASYGGKSRVKSKAKKSSKKDNNVVYINTKPKQMDFSLLIIVFMLVMFGLVMIFSSSYYIALTRHENQDPLMFIKKQAMFAVIGTVAMFFTANFDYKILRRYSPMFYLVANALLVIVLIVAEALNGAKRWLVIGPVQFQPSEVAKIATILYLSAYVAKNKDILKTFGGFMKCMTIVMIPVVLIAIENFSTAIVVAALGTAIIFVASPVIWYFIAMIAPAVGAGILAVTLPDFKYRFDRIKTWYDPFADTTGLGFQTVQSLYAVASGGFFGLGLGQSRQKLGYIPEAYNDIIFSIVCEELGLFGAAALVLLFYTLIYKGTSIAIKCTDLYGSLVATGITCMIAVQVIINIAVNTNAMPVTGMPLPFISYGGSSLLIMMSCMGVLINISRYTRD